MRRLIYSPKVNIWIRIFDGRVIDVSDFVVRGEVVRKINEVSTAQIELRNPRKIWSQPQPEARKRIDPNLTWPFFHPMDPITIYLTRKPNSPVQVFTGYLDEVPYLTLTPDTVKLKASCTLKKILLTQWDPALPFAQSFMRQFGWMVSADGTMANNLVAENEPMKIASDPNEGPPPSDAPPNTPPGDPPPPPPVTDHLDESSFKALLENSLQYIAGWDPAAIYIEPLPTRLVEKAASIFQAISKESQDAYEEYKKFIVKVIGPNSGGGGNAAVAGAQDCQHLADIWTSNGGDPSKAALFASIAICESSGDPNQENSIGATGLWQVLQSAHPEWASQNLKDPNVNAKAAIQISSNGTNTSPWVSSQGCWGSRPACNSVQPGAPAPAPSPGVPGPGGAPAAPNPNDPNATGPNDCHKMGQGSCGGCTVEICAYGNYLKGKGFQVTEAPCFGGVSSGAHVGNSQHDVGNAIDVSMGPGDKAKGDALSQEALGFGFRTIWQGVIQPGGEPWEDHFDHVHIDNANCTAHFNGTGGGGGPGGGDPNAYVRAAAFAQVINFPGVLDLGTAYFLASQGEKALMATSSLFPFIQELAHGSMRSFMSMPDGRFYAFYPDYFGGFADDPTKTAYWEIDDLEVLDGKIQLSDEPLATHVFVLADLLYNQTFGGDASGGFPNIADYAQSTGVVSIVTAIMGDFLNLKPEDIDPNYHPANPPPPPGDPADPNKPPPTPALFDKSLALRFLDRFGARPFVSQQPQIRSPFIELIVAMQTFMLMWARQFQTDFQFTFMPELYPGGRVRFTSHGFEAFVEEVRHNFDFASGFTTDARLQSPSTIPGQSAEMDAMSVGMVRGAALDQTGTHPATDVDKQQVNSRQNPNSAGDPNDPANTPQTPAPPDPGN